MSSLLTAYDPWPALSYPEFKSTGYLLHMGVQAIGKLKLLTPFEPHWANVALWVTSRGLSSGLIPYKSASFSVEVDLIEHQIICYTSWGKSDHFALRSMSVTDLTKTLFSMLNNMGIETKINPIPQEIPNPISFDQDQEIRHYDPKLAYTWWKVLLSSTIVLQRYHARFKGISPKVGLMWGTFDLRDARYQNIPVPTEGPNAGYLRRNAMDVAQVEAGWWAGNDAYPKSAYYSFTYPKPANIENAKIKPAAARWDNNLQEFILDYDDLRQSSNPEADLLAFFETTYQAGAYAAHWEEDLIGAGEPV